MSKKDKEPPIISEVSIQYLEGEAVISENKAPTKMEADRKALKTLQEALDPKVISFIKKIEITFAEEPSGGKEK